MKLFPVNLDIRAQKVVVVGAGRVAGRKCDSLLEAEAAVTIIAPDASPAITDLAREGKVTLQRRPFQRDDLEGAVLVFAAANDRAVNGMVAEESRRRGIPVCVVDLPEEGTFTSPSVVRRGELLITISTGGRSPALARKIRLELESRYGPEYASLVEELGALREKLLTQGAEDDYYRQIFNELLHRGLPHAPIEAGVETVDHRPRTGDAVDGHHTADSKEDP